MIPFPKLLRVPPLSLTVLLLGLAITMMAIPTGNVAADHTPTPQDFKVAFIGDQGSGINAAAVLQLIVDRQR